MDKEAIFRNLKFGVSGESLVLNAPDEYLSILEGATFDTIPVEAKMGKYGFVQVFASSQAEMETLVESVAKAGKYDCLFWACYPKGIGKQKYDLNRDTVWKALALAGLRPVSQIAINEKWSALRGRDPELVGK
ncbi:MAG TPA: hypothetical protein DCL77_00270 [Prolixibacteraceae bacterium]|jgi:hypothetical protein|nr:hypothetical protein [Prolixibacteraceae bacterium]